MDRIFTRYYYQQVGREYGDENIGPLIRSQKIYQIGRGLGGFFSGIFRHIRPLFTSALHGLKSEVLETGADIIRGINIQKPLNEILRDRSVQVVDKLRDKATEKIKKMSGAGLKRRLQNSIKGCACKKLKQSLVKPRRKKKNKIKQKPKTRIIDIFN
jgi:hypothetical protein